MIFINPTIGLAMPTDQDWGRLYNFNTSGDSGLIMPPRSYYFRNFIAGGWTDISIGFIFATKGATGSDQSVLVNEFLAATNPTNLFHFGLTQTTNNAIDVGSNPTFVGLRASEGSNSQILAASKLLTLLIPTRILNGVPSTSGSTVSLNLTEGVSGTPFNMVGLRFIHNPLNGQLYMNRAVSNGIALANEAANITTLQAFLNGISNSTTSPTAQFSVSNTAAFNSFYIFWPFLANQLKLHCVGAIKLG